MVEPTLRAPFPAFGGKSRVAAEVWRRFGDVRNYVEPFCFSAAVLLKRPGPGAVETINDRNLFVANFWRAVKGDPNAVALHADWPVSEVDLHARHRWLVGSGEARAKLAKVGEDPDYFDAKIAGWWCWGACCWIGSGWCDEVSAARDVGGEEEVEEDLTGDLPRPRPPGADTPSAPGGAEGDHGSPVPLKVPHLDAVGRGVQGSVVLSQQVPHLDAGPNEKRPAIAQTHGLSTGIVNVSNAMEMGGPNERRPGMSQAGWGINVGDSGHAKRPMISADGSEFGRGIHGRPKENREERSESAGACENRSRWIRGWMEALADRMRSVRVCCGHWDRVCDSPSTMTRLGTTGVFLDPPYRVTLACGKKNRTRHIYANDKHQDVNALCDEVRAWCLKWGREKDVKIALCGLEGEYPEIEAAGWSVFAWKSSGGYGNRSAAKGENKNAERERIWFSPGCDVPAEEPVLWDVEK